MGKINELKDFTRGQLDAALMKIGQDVGMDTAEGIRAFLSGELRISRLPHGFREERDMIYFSASPTDGTTGLGWIERFRKQKFELDPYAKMILESQDFQPTSGIINEVVILKSSLFKDHERLTNRVRAEAEKRKLITPSIEIACLIREKFSNLEFEAIGLRWIAVMHKPVKNGRNAPFILGIDAKGNDGLSFAFEDQNRWSQEGGFAFVVSQSKK
jgi:hypothetical protein